MKVQIHHFAEQFFHQKKHERNLENCSSHFKAKLENSDGWK